MNIEPALRDALLAETPNLRAFAVSLTGKVAPYKLGFGPFPPEIYHAPYPDAHTPLAEVKKAVHHIFKADIEPSRVAAIVFERAGEDWIGHILAADAVLRMPEIGAEVPLTELYDGFDPAAD